MMDVFWTAALKPFVALAFFAVALVAARMLWHVIPPGRVKQVLFDRTLQKKHPWKFGLGLLVGCWGVMLLIGYLTYRGG